MLTSTLNPRQISGSTEIDVTSLSYDSRCVSKGGVFFALKGEKVDGLRFVPQALERGAAAVVASDPAPDGGCEAAWIEVEDARMALADAARVFYGEPSAAMPVAGVTGTNGKTTTAFLLHHLIKSTWMRCGLLGTILYDTGEDQKTAERTTPEALDVQAMLAEMRNAACRAAVMEVSSHGLAQQRVRGVLFDVGLFTNLTRDHLDYHGTMESYFEAKKLLFDALSEQGGGKKPAAVINFDDTYGKRLLKMFEGKLNCISFGQGIGSDFRATDVRSDYNGTVFKLEAKKRSFLVRLPLLGRYNAYNALGALAAGSALGINLRESIAHLAEAPQVPGRLESVVELKSYKVLVDYAHTPDALENALKAVREVSLRRVITVFGCGGDRDRQKRPLMGRAADQLSDVTIVTSDNPRTEDPGRIIEDILKGMPSGRAMVVEDRREAIREALSMARTKDIVLIAGKGHEAYQEIGGERSTFNDADEARWAAEELSENFEARD